MDLFDLTRESNAIAPLADRMRPRTLSEFVGQKHIVSPTSLLSRAIIAGKTGSCIFYGPAGCGKTSLANIISEVTKGEMVKLNAVTSGVSDIRKTVDEAKERLALYGTKTYLFLDECHRFNKAQMDSLLPSVEKGDIIFIGSTTENPYVALTPAIVSRCRVFEFKKLTDEEIIDALKKCLTDERGFKNLNVSVEEEAFSHFAFVANGDLRDAYNALELAVLSTYADKDGVVHITKKDAEESSQKRGISVDESLFYDILSAFCKSLRGSDPDAALYYAERLISAGCDPMIIARRLVVHSAEDVGLANHDALVVATSAMYALEKIGLPEARIPLSEAIIYVCLSPKSNSVVMALSGANEDAKNNSDDDIPKYLRDNSYGSAEDKAESRKYKYPHNYGGYVDQQYLPDSLKAARYYRPSKNGEEATIIVPKDANKK